MGRTVYLHQHDSAWLYGKCRKLYHTWILYPYVSKFNNHSGRCFLLVSPASNGLKNMTWKPFFLELLKVSEDSKNGKIKDSNQSNNHLLLYILGLGKSLVLVNHCFIFMKGTLWICIVQLLFQCFGRAQNNKIHPLIFTSEEIKIFHRNDSNWQGMLELEPQPFRS